MINSQQLILFIDIKKSSTQQAMFNYLIRRILYSLSVLLGVLLLVFALFRWLPDPARLTMGQRSDAESIEAVRRAEHLDEPLWKQFIFYLNDISPLSLYEDTPAHRAEYRYTPLFKIGEKTLCFKKPFLRRSYQSRRRVSDIILEALPTTLLIGSLAMLLASVLGIVLGVVAALKKNTPLDHFIVAASALGISQPSYFAGILIALLLGYWLKDYTGLNHSGSLYTLDDGGNAIFQAKNMILPLIALGLRPLAIIVQLTRSSMIDTLSQDFIRTAHAKGLSRKTVFFKHALRNALNPVATAISGWFASVLTGAFFIELIFDCKGLGYVSVVALNNLDFPLVMGAVLFTATLFIIVNMLTDLLYAWIDPRVRVE